MLLTVKGTAPTSVMVKVCCRLVATGVVPKGRDQPMETFAMVPVPTKETLWGLFAALSLMSKDPGNPPGVVGWNVTLTKQLEPGAIAAPQLLVWEDCPVVWILETVTGTGPLFDNVTPSAGLVVPTTTVPK